MKYVSASCICIYIPLCLSPRTLHIYHYRPHTYIAHLSTLYLNYLSSRQHIYIYPRPPTLGPRMSSLAFGASTPTQTTSEPVGVSRYDWFLTQSKTLPLGPLSLLLTTCVNLVCRPSEQPPLINYGYACSKLVTLTRERISRTIFYQEIHQI